MKIKVAKTAGFCMGVRRAVDMVLDLQRESPPVPIITYGPLIHNPLTLKLLESRGITEVDSLEHVRGGTVVIRAHGISPAEMLELKIRSEKIVDATCPRVARVQSIIRKHARQGHYCIIVGDQDHPEVRGLIGFASSGGLAVTEIEDKNQLVMIPTTQPVCVVAQTTQEVDAFYKIVGMLKSRFDKVHVYDTICDSTRKRQSEVAKLSRQVDMIVVVGGKGSGNTRRLVKVAIAQGIPALHIETEDEVNESQFSGIDVLGVTAGASTPNWQILGVMDKLKQIGRKRRTSFVSSVRRAADILVMTYCLAALGGGGLTAACMVLQGLEVNWISLATTSFFVLSMHLLNRIHDRSGATRFNTPEIADFYSRHRLSLTTVAILSSISALLLAYFSGVIPFILLLVMVITGGLYTTPLISRKLFPNAKWRSLKDLPGSKTPLVAFGWAMACSVAPVLSSGSPHNPKSVIVSFVFAAGMVLWRTVLSDLLDVQGDRIVGRDTIPILLGQKKTSVILKVILVSLACLLIISGSIGLVNPRSIWLTVNVAIMALFLLAYQRHHLVDRLILEGTIDGNLVLAGVIAFSFGSG
jgi:(E)-4-hydroxy-3-methyl-but-2-enyl pyrophosphate reductase